LRGILINMALNWTIEVISGLIVSIFILVLSLLLFLKLRDIRSKSLLFFKMTIFTTIFLYFIESLGDLFLNIYLSLISYYVEIPILIFFILFVTLSQKDSPYSLGLLFTCLFSPIYIISSFLPGAIKIIFVPEFQYLKIKAFGFFELFNNIFLIMSVVYLAYWGILTWKNTPFLYKKEAFLIIISTVIASSISIILSFLIAWHQIFIILSDIFFVVVLSLLIYILIREPKMFYILPFILHRIVVKDRDGFPIFDHDWAESTINETVFAGFINAVQIMSEEVMDFGGLLDINLQEGILMVYESKFITVGLSASKSSKLLRDCVKNFTLDFEEQFSHLLKTSCKDKKKYEPAYLLIDKYFSNFPYRIIPNKYHPLIVSGADGKIPLQLDDKYDQIFQDEKDMEQIKLELLRSPLSSHDDFLNLYEELKDENDVNFDPDEK